MRTDPRTPIASEPDPLALAAARRVVFLATGPAKAGVARRAVEGDVNLPAARVAAESVNVSLMLDAAAASGLERPSGLDAERGEPE